MVTNLNKTLLYVGYGSLLSGYGLLAARRGGRSRLVAVDAEPAIVLNARRGLAKPSSHGNYLAMDIEPLDPGRPITARTGLCEADDRGFGALLLTFDRSAAPLISRREEYDPDAFVRLLEHADRAGLPFGEFLLNFARDADFNLLRYREALRGLLGYTSEGYIFHPLPLEDGPSIRSRFRVGLFQFKLAPKASAMPDTSDSDEFLRAKSKPDPPSHEIETGATFTTFPHPHRA